MSYVDKILLPNETLVYTARLHWFVYLPAIKFALLAIAALVASAQVGSSLLLALHITASALAALAVLTWFRGFIKRATTEFAVTDRRIIFKRGLLQRHTVEMSKGRIASVDVDQSITGRILGYGTVTLHIPGGGIEPLRNISNPFAFRSHVTAR
jgi:uncharacterized membrane protein YdbT with pleckstrin-like domain